MAYGIGSAQGMQRVRRELPERLALAEPWPGLGREGGEDLRERLLEWERRIPEYEHRVEHLAKQHEAPRRLLQGEGGGPLTATAGGATLGHGQAFQHGRQFAAGVGVVPTQPSTGGKPVWGRISKPGNVYLRTLLLHGARAGV